MVVLGRIRSIPERDGRPWNLTAIERTQDPYRIIAEPNAEREHNRSGEIGLQLTCRRLSSIKVKICSSRSD